MQHQKNRTVRVLLTGADGFIGKNLALALSTRGNVELIRFTRKQSREELPNLVKGIDCVVHLAGVNRTSNEATFADGNTELTAFLCKTISNSRPSQPVKFILSSSTQAERDNPYGKSKRAAEEAVFNCAAIEPFVFRLPNVFGKWCKPNYNSAVATFCHNIAHGLSVTIHDPSAVLTLAYIDDVLASFTAIIDGQQASPVRGAFADIQTTYKTTVGELVHQIEAFHKERKQIKTQHVGAGLQRGLYATYLSYLPPEDFGYDLLKHSDARGIFVEMLKTPSSGQFSYFTAKPGITRGGHYHHTKNEKFLVINGTARFKFRNMNDGQTAEIITTGETPRVVDTVPGWAHDITNVGDEDLIVMLWANEVFDRERPDTYAWALRST